MSREDFLRDLESGTCRAARKVSDKWEVDTSVKTRILDIFRSSAIKHMPGGFQDKHLLTTQQFSLHSNIRLVPGGSSVRAGAYIGKNVVIMPPSYVNIGAYVDENTMIDSHVLVGSCAQVGKRVHLSAAVQIGGVLEPIGQRPVIVEDDCFLGAGVILTEGILLEERAVLAAGVVLSASVPIYDSIHKRVFKGKVPANAVVVPGTRPATNNWANKQGIHLGCAVIAKYRDSSTSAAVVLEDILR